MRKRVAEQTQFSISVESGPEGHTIEVVGELDLASAPELRDAVAVIEGSKEMGPDSNLVIDLSDVTFIDSTGVKALLDAARAARESREAVELRFSPVVERTLSICGLNGHLDGARSGMASNGRDDAGR